jgi:hypothetical protein
MERTLRPVDRELWKPEPTTERPRALTHDEKKAAEAAFRADAFNPTWSAAARKVYDGIVEAMVRRGIGSVVNPDTEVEFGLEVTDGI